MWRCGGKGGWRQAAGVRRRGAEQGGHISGRSIPTAMLSVMSASVEVMSPLPFTSQMQSRQLRRLTAAFKTKSASLAVVRAAGPALLASGIGSAQDCSANGIVVEVVEVVDVEVVVVVVVVVVVISSEEEVVSNRDDDDDEPKPYEKHPM